MYRTGLGVCSHRFLPAESAKPCKIAGIFFDDTPGFQGNADGDVVFYALCHAITSLIGVEVIGEIASTLWLHEGITDSEVYLQEAKKLLKEQKITHIAISLEAKRPHFKAHILKMRAHIAKLLGLSIDQVGITAISGDGLSDEACGDGVRCIAIITTQTLV